MVQLSPDERVCREVASAEGPGQTPWAILQASMNGPRTKQSWNHYRTRSSTPSSAQLHHDVCLEILGLYSSLEAQLHIRTSTQGNGTAVGATASTVSAAAAACASQQQDTQCVLMLMAMQHTQKYPRP